jgi:LruC domain-containing protein
MDATTVIAAHAVVQKELPCPIKMYGTSLGLSTAGDKIYEIDVNSLTATELFNTGLSSSSKNGPNGNAYDPVNNRFYYSKYSSSDYLYFYDFTNPVNNPSGALPGGQVACAGWYNGMYYYIPQNTGKLYQATFNADGTINMVTMVKDYSGKSFSFGDVVVNTAGLLYGSSAVNTVGKFWTIDLSDYTYTEISNLVHMQLAFGSDGDLYGHDAANGNFYSIDATLGTRTLIGQIGNLKFTDLASGPYKPCTIVEETAWADGTDFAGKNWATMITYQLQYKMEQMWPEGGTSTIAFEDLPLSGSLDWDYNDWVADVDIQATYWGTESDRDILQVDFTVTPEARGAGYNHAFHLKIPADTFASDGTYTLTIYDGDGIQLSQTIAAFDASIANDFTVVPSTTTALPGSLTNTVEPTGIVSHYPTEDNTDVNAPKHEPYVAPKRTATLSIVFNDMEPFELSDYNPYSGFHGQGLFFDPYLYVYDTANYIHVGDSRMLTVPSDWMWPEAGIAIWKAYTSGVTAGDPTTNPPTFASNWWTTYNDLVYNGKP